MINVVDILLHHLRRTLIFTAKLVYMSCEIWNHSSYIQKPEDGGQLEP